MGTLGSRIQHWRKAKDWTMADLARATQVSAPYLSQLERGERDAPSADILYRIASALGVTMADLIEDESPTVKRVDRLPADIPESLRKFIKQRGAELDLKPEDINMLASIRYRGRQPRTVEDWEDLLRFIRRAFK